MFFLAAAAAASLRERMNVSVWLSGAAYCEKHQYPTMVLGGPAQGFVYHTTLYDWRTDVQGYIGVLHSTKTIYVVIRGSESVRNWIRDFEVRKMAYSHCAGAEVHRGFYLSALAIRNQTIDAITAYPYYSVLVTGHSYGAAVGQLLAMTMSKDMSMSKAISIDLINFGQPRIGNAAYVKCASEQLREYARVTHDRDMVVHLPPRVLEFQHSCVEYFENAHGQIVECSECEDPMCAGQYQLRDTNVDDHMVYLGHELSCEASTIR